MNGQRRDIVVIGARGDHAAAVEWANEARVARERAELIWNLMFERVQGQGST